MSLVTFFKADRLQRMPSGRQKLDDEQKKSDPQNPGEIDCYFKVQGDFHDSAIRPESAGQDDTFVLTARDVAGVSRCEL